MTTVFNIEGLIPMEIRKVEDLRWRGYPLITFTGMDARILHAGVESMFEVDSRISSSRYYLQLCLNGGKKHAPVKECGVYLLKTEIDTIISFRIRDSVVYVGENFLYPESHPYSTLTLN